MTIDGGMKVSDDEVAESRTSMNSCFLFFDSCFVRARGVWCGCLVLDRSFGL